MRVGALWGSRWGKEATGLWEDLQLTVLRVESTAWPWPSEGSRLGVTGAVCPGKAAGLRTPRWVSGGLAGAGFVLLFRRTAAPTERKVRDPQGVLGVADSWVGGGSNLESPPSCHLPSLPPAETGRGPLRSPAFSAASPSCPAHDDLKCLCLFLISSPPGHRYHRNAVFTLWLAVHNNRAAYDVRLYHLWCTSGAFGTEQY